jgi:predicted O-methyltransferase YrrM
LTLKSFAPEPVARYVCEVMTRETPLQRRLREETAKLPRSGMQIAADQGALMALLVRLTGTRRALEIGTFTGYSALAVATALPEDGLLIACDVSEEWTRIARRYWEEAGVSRRIDLRLGPAADTLAALLSDGAADTFDFAFIDADKENGAAYYEACLKLVRPGGLIIIDNALWDGDVANASVQDAETKAIRTLNEKVRDDARVQASLVTVGDGMLLAWKRPAPQGGA